MSKKKNLDSAMFSMFGVSNDVPAEETAAAKVEEPKVEAEPVRPAAVAAAPAGVTYLAPNSVMEGKLQTDGDVEIVGSFNGEIIAKGKVILHSNMQGDVTATSLQLLGCSLVGNINASGQVQMDRKASVVGNVTAGELVCSGTIKGDLDIKGNLALNEGSIVEGNIVTRTMTMSQGAVITGGVKMNLSNK
ncbi:MAG: polymer-forming cytoskeletal protein [Oscillospiraceae bacterium]|nr:polymer-forming cytoskeletal protein [Oscillospiraceae bacterium]